MDIRLLLFLTATTMGLDPASNPCENAEETLVPHPDPQKYYYCRQGIPTEGSCPGGTIFNATMDACVSSSGDETISIHEIPSRPNCGPIHCGDDDHWKNFDPMNCSYYYLCDYGTLRHIECPGGQHFNETLGSCTTAPVARCSNITQIITSPPTYIIPTFTPTTLSQLPPCGAKGWKEIDLTSCNHYYKCENGRYSYESCLKGYKFSPLNKECEPQEVAGCSQTTDHTLPYTVVTSPPYRLISLSYLQCEGDKQEPDTTHCSYYYRCTNKKMKRFKCPKDEYFSLKDLVCKPEKEVDCLSRSTSTYKPSPTPPSTDEPPVSTAPSMLTIHELPITTHEPDTLTTFKIPLNSTEEQSRPTTDEPPISIYEPHMPTTYKLDTLTTFEPPSPTTDGPHKSTYAPSQLTIHVLPTTTLEPHIRTKIEPSLPATYEPPASATVDPPISTYKPSTRTINELPTTTHVPNTLTTFEPPTPTTDEPPISTYEPKLTTQTSSLTPITDESQTTLELERSTSTTQEPPSSNIHELPLTTDEPLKTTTDEPLTSTTHRLLLPTTLNRSTSTTRQLLATNIHDLPSTTAAPLTPNKNEPLEPTTDEPLTPTTREPVHLSTQKQSISTSQVVFTPTINELPTVTTLEPHKPTTDQLLTPIIHEPIYPSTQERSTLPTPNIHKRLRTTDQPLIPTTNEPLTPTTDETLTTTDKLPIANGLPTQTKPFLDVIPITTKSITNPRPHSTIYNSTITEFPNTTISIQITTNEPIQNTFEPLKSTVAPSNTNSAPKTPSSFPTDDSVLETTIPPATTSQRLPISSSLSTQDPTLATDGPPNTYDPPMSTTPVPSVTTTISLITLEPTTSDIYEPSISIIPKQSATTSPTLTTLGLSRSDINKGPGQELECKPREKGHCISSTTTIPETSTHVPILTTDESLTTPEPFMTIPSTLEPVSHIYEPSISKSREPSVTTPPTLFTLVPASNPVPPMSTTPDPSMTTWPTLTTLELSRSDIYEPPISTLHEPPVTITSPLCGAAEWFAPDPFDCSSYYQCEGGYFLQKSCPKDYEFSPSDLTCLPKFEANCYSRTILFPVTTVSSTSRTPASDRTGIKPVIPQEQLTATYNLPILNSLVLSETLTSTTYEPPTTHEPSVTTYEPPMTTSEPPDATHEPLMTTNESPMNRYEPVMTTYETPEPTHRPPMTTYEPPMNRYEPLMTTNESPMNRYALLMTTYDTPEPTHRPPMTTYGPPMDRYKSFMTTYKPPETTHKPPMTTYKPSTLKYEPSITTYESPIYQPQENTHEPSMLRYELPATTYEPPMTTNEPPMITNEPFMTRFRSFMYTCGVEEWLAPDPKDCSRYYQCWNKQILLNTCPGDYLFDPFDLECKPPDEVNCKSILDTVTAKANIVTTNEPATTHEPTIPHYKPFIPSTDELHILTTPEPSTELSLIKAFPIPSFPTKYLTISPSPLTSFTTTTPSIITTPNSLTSTPTTTPTSLTSLTTPISDYLVDLRCEITDAWIVLDPSDCEFYYLCIRGQISHTKCPYNFDFSSEKKECLPKSMARCKIKSNNKVTTLSPTVSSNTVASVTVHCVNSTARPLYFIINNNDCRNYYMCALGIGTWETCPEGYEFSPKYLTCLPSDEAQCGGLCTSNDVRFVADPHDVTRYYICFEGKQLPQKCPAGFHFDTTIEMCQSKREPCEE